jgi:DNA mismatch endonuclease (patch repair protein)
MTSKNTKPEVRLQNGLIARGHDIDLHVKGLPGTPDIVFSEQNIAVFVHGCYWHRHQGCSVQRKPTEYSVTETKRRNSTVLRDAKVAQDILKLGWTQYIAWECHINSALPQVLDDIEEKIRLK